MVVSVYNENEKKRKETYHCPVMVEEVLEYLDLHIGETVIDSTVGCGGHSEEILGKILPGGKLIGIDQDEESLLIAQEKLQQYEDNVMLIKENFQNLIIILERLGVKTVDKILFDLGVSWFQIRNPERGFSFKYEGPLDMRMDRNKKISAFDLINNLSFEEISNIIKKFGEERWHRRIAKAILKQRKEELINTTGQLADIIKSAVPSKYRYGRIHPATRTFQAFRIVVNRELVSLEKGLRESINCLKPGGRICVISFHSLEDRLVKHLFRDFASHGQIKILTKKPVRAKSNEVDKNLKSRSAKLRAAEKINLDIKG